MSTPKATLKAQILAALSHPEAEAGLYFENLTTVHEDEERVAVEGEQEEILEALKELIDEDKITMEDSGEKLVFYLK